MTGDPFLDYLPPFWACFRAFFNGFCASFNSFYASFKTFCPFLNGFCASFKTFRPFFKPFQRKYNVSYIFQTLSVLFLPSSALFLASPALFWHVSQRKFNILLFFMHHLPIIGRFQSHFLIFPTQIKYNPVRLKPFRQPAAP